MWQYYSAVKKKIVICNNTDGPRDYHTKWSKSEKDKHHIISLMWNLKYDTNELIYKTETDSHWKQTYGYQRGRGWGRNQLGVWD